MSLARHFVRLSARARARRRQRRPDWVVDKIANPVWDGSLPDMYEPRSTGHHVGYCEHCGPPGEVEGQ